MSEAILIARRISLSIEDVIAAWESEPIQTKVQQGETALNLIIGIVGLFFPPVAAAQNDIKVAETVVNLSMNLIAVFSKYPIALPHPQWTFKFTPETEAHYRARVLDDGSFASRIGS